MPLNDRDQELFSSVLEDEHIFDANPPPGTEMLGELVDPMRLQHDTGSGSYAEDGRREVAEDEVMQNGEAQIGSAAMYGPTEIGAGDFGIDAVGDDDELGAAAAADREGSELSEFASIVGAAAAADREGSEIFGEGMIGQFAEDGASEIGSNGGYIAAFGPSEIGAGHYPIDGASELGQAGSIEPSLTPFDLFMESETRMGAAAAADREGSEIFGHGMIGAADRGYGSEIGWGGFDEVGWGGFDEVGWGGFDEVGRNVDEVGWGEFSVGEAVAAVVEKARDNRCPCPPLRAVDPEEPFDEDEYTEVLTKTLVGVAKATGHPNPFPLTSDLMLRAGAGLEPRMVRVDTEESYKEFRHQHSPELAELSARLDAHINDPNAHMSHVESEFSDGLDDDIDDLVHLGAEAHAAEAEKRVELWMPRRFDGLVEGWQEGENVCASMTLPGHGGELRICTTLEPVRKCVSEMSRHAAESGVPVSVVGGVIPAMGCVLGVGTALKEMAAAAPAVVNRPEMASKAPFIVRVEPKVSPALSALAMLAMACRAGNAQAQEEWNNLSVLCPPTVKQAMQEAVQIAKAA